MIRWVVAITIFLGGCTGPNRPGIEPAGTPAELRGVTWRATEIGGVPVLPQNVPSMKFEANSFSGGGTCNSFSGTNAFPAPGRISLRFSSTEMGCLDRQLMDQEDRYYRQLGKVTSYRLEPDGSLSLLAPDGGSVRFRR